MIIDEKDCLKEVESFDKTGFNYTLSFNVITIKHLLSIFNIAYDLFFFI